MNIKLDMTSWAYITYSSLLLGRNPRVPPVEHLRVELAPAAGRPHHGPARCPLPRHTEHHEGQFSWANTAVS